MSRCTWLNWHAATHGEWQHLKRQIDAFGNQAGLFDELRVRLLGSKDSDPFQLQVRKGAKRVKGPFRNLIDVGYGVSQVLPIVTELLRPNGAKQFLFQQPEVHLHPSAQASLGSLFCTVAASGRQLIVETHSDHSHRSCSNGRPRRQNELSQR